MSNVQRPSFYWCIIEIFLLWISCSDNTNHAPASPSLCSLRCLRVRQKSRSSTEFKSDGRLAKNDQKSGTISRRIEIIFFLRPARHCGESIDMKRTEELGTDIRLLVSKATTCVRTCSSKCFCKLKTGMFRCSTLFYIQHLHQ